MDTAAGGIEGLASTLNAHYTSPLVVRSIYRAIEGMGFRSGNILEPACGTGNFFGAMPENLRASTLYGVELDSLTGRIAQKLYPDAHISIQGFEHASLPDDYFDVAVGNVPFGAYSLADARYDRFHFRIHDYFFAKTLDKVRPGGLIAFVTSKGTMDKQDASVRRYIAQRAELLGAIRLPNTAFKANANFAKARTGTEPGNCKRGGFTLARSRRDRRRRAGQPVFSRSPGHAAGYNGL